MNRNDSQNGNGKQEEHEKPVWTIMVYLAGDNNLTTNCISVLQQLEAVKYNEDICVLACFDSNTPWPKGSRYLAISSRRQRGDDRINWEIHNDLIPSSERGDAIRAPNFCEVNGDYSGNTERVTRPAVAEGLKRFLNWAVEHNEESEKYMLILFGHGPVVAGQTFLARENPPSSLRFEDLKEILGRHFGPASNPELKRRFGPEKKLDILACQNCVMNGIETAYEVKDHVEFMIGSQGLVLAAGWPYEKIIGAIVENPKAESEEISRKLLKACARNLLDFSVMDRSSEQSVCNLARLQERDQNITMAIKDLAAALQEGLAFTEENLLRYSIIPDAVRLARLEAQSYWGEVFVDLYDFCERLLKKCNEAVLAHNNVLKELGSNGDMPKKFRETGLMKTLKEIARCCIEVMKAIERIVPLSYYIGSDLQYSHGLSIYFPWTLPGEPYFFTQIANAQDFVLKTAFETYSEYSFAKDSGWGDFLKTFFKATLRKVRRSDRDFFLRDDSESLDQGLIGENIHAPAEVLAIDLQKSSPDTGRVDQEVWSNIKNYPRRNYLSPSDCSRRVDQAGSQKPGDPGFVSPTSPSVSYLGWNISGLVAEVITADPAKLARNGAPNQAEQAPTASAQVRR